jgi:hypothetical protein
MCTYASSVNLGWLCVSFRAAVSVDITEISTTTMVLNSARTTIEMSLTLSPCLDI